MSNNNNNADERIDGEKLEEQAFSADTDVVEHLKTAYKDIEKIIDEVGSSSAKNSKYQKKLQSVDDKLLSLKLLEANIQEIKMPKDEYKDLFGEFSSILGNMKKELKDKQLSADTKKMHDEMMKDREMAKHYGAKIAMDEPTLRKKIGIIIQSPNAQTYTAEFGDIQSKLVSGSNQQMIHQLLKTMYFEYSGIGADLPQKNIATLALTFADIVEHVDKPFYDKMISLVENTFGRKRMKSFLKATTKGGKGKDKGRSGPSGKRSGGRGSGGRD